MSTNLERIQHVRRLLAWLASHPVKQSGFKRGGPKRRAARVAALTARLVSLGGRP